MQHRSAIPLAVSVVFMFLFWSCSQHDRFVLDDTIEFSTIESSAEDSKVRFYMWGGDARINQWIDGFAAESIRDRYAIELVRVAEDAEIFVNKLITEKQAGRSKGSIDLMWINGENFKNAREARVLFGPFADHLPNYRSFVDPDSVAFDFGYPVDGYEAPYGRAQFVFEYDSARVDPPASFAELSEWVQKHPGRFTYPQPPSFTGSAFIRQALYAVAGGYEQFTVPYDQEAFETASQTLWSYLNALEPYLWQEGRTYPKDKAPLDGLFQRGEILINMSYHQADASGRIRNGQYPDTVRTFVMREGSLFNTHYTAIAYNAPNPKGAMVVANFLLSPDAQYHKNDPSHWGDFTILDIGRLSPSDQARFEQLDLGIATLDLETLSASAVPEIAPEYVEALESGWEKHVLDR